MSDRQEFLFIFFMGEIKREMGIRNWELGIGKWELGTRN
jgi:hypothetical protein